MTLRILQYPDDRLRVKAEPVVDFSPGFQQLVDDMIETMYSAHGVGLAAPQVGIAKRVFVVDTGNDLWVFCNPSVKSTGAPQPSQEGCLSLPGVREVILRPQSVHVRAQDRFGTAFTLETSGLQAVAISHENDHLDGVLMLDHMGSLRRRQLDRKLRKR